MIIVGGGWFLGAQTARARKDLYLSLGVDEDHTAEGADQTAALTGTCKLTKSIANALLDMKIDQLPLGRHD